MPRQAVRTFLQMADPAELQPAPAPPAVAEAIQLRREDNAPPALWRHFYTEVGREYHWVDRLPWTDEDIARYLRDPAIEFWVLRVAEEPAGYFELRQDGEDGVEIAYFGLLPPFTGRGLGKYLLTAATERAWARGAARVWLHTSSLDHSSALSNYLGRGFSIWKQETYDV
jgi:ribosomal protein S18 acetylase RimI-like enzyme